MWENWAASSVCNYIEDVKKVKEKQSQFSQGVINLDPQL